MAVGVHGLPCSDTNMKLRLEGRPRSGWKCVAPPHQYTFLIFHLLDLRFWTQRTAYITFRGCQCRSRRDKTREIRLGTDRLQEFQDRQFHRFGRTREILEGTMLLR